MRKPIKMGVGVGGPSILGIFAVLCLTTLCALALLTANADWQLSQKTADSVTDYYAADTAAEQWLAELDAGLQTGQPPKAVTFRTPVGERQQLVLTVQGRSYGVTSSRLETLEDWQYDEYQPQFSDALPE